MMKQDRRSRWTEEEVDRIRRKIHEKTDEMIQRMMWKTADGQDPYDLDFTGREAVAEGISKEIGLLLLQEHLCGDRWQQTVQEASSWKCPRCGQDAPPAKDSQGNDVFGEVQMKTKLGTLPMKSRQFCCGNCRKVFFPLPTAP